MKQYTQLIIWEKLPEARNPTYYGLHNSKARYLKNSKRMKVL